MFVIAKSIKRAGAGPESLRFGAILAFFRKLRGERPLLALRGELYAHSVLHDNDECLQEELSLMT